MHHKNQHNSSVVSYRQHSIVCKEPMASIQVATFLFKKSEGEGKPCKKKPLLIDSENIFKEGNLLHNSIKLPKYLIRLL